MADIHVLERGHRAPKDWTVPQMLRYLADRIEHSGYKAESGILIWTYTDKEKIYSTYNLAGEFTDTNLIGLLEKTKITVCYDCGLDIIPNR